MHPSSDAIAAGVFRRLERDLLRRRLLSLDLVLRLEMLAIFVLIAMFVFWRARNPLDHWGRIEGPIAVARIVAELSLALAAVAAGLTWARHRRVLRHGAPGPPWLALPVPPALLSAHLARLSALHGLWMLIPAVGIFVAAIGLVPPLVWLGLAAGFLLLLAGAARLGCAIAYRMAGRGIAARGRHPIETLLAVAARPAPSAAGARSRLEPHAGPIRALLAKDLLLAWRAPGARRRVLPALGLAVLAVLAWMLAPPPGAGPLPPHDLRSLPLAHVVAFGLTLAAAAAWGEFLIALAGEDPFPVLRSLPLGVGRIWVSRMTWAVVFLAALEIAHAIAWRGTEGAARALFLEWTAGAGIAITTLAVNYGLTLFPRAIAAQRLYMLSLGLAIAGSLMIPLMGWVVLLTGVIHSARRLPRWERLEEGA